MNRPEDLLGPVEAARPEPEPDDAEALGGRRPSQASRLVALAGEADLFHSPEGEPYASITAEGHRETWPLRRDGFRDWLAHRFYLAERTAPGAQAMQDALAALGGRARYEGLERAVHLRVAEHEGAIFLDLADPAWNVIEVDRTGWRLSASAPVRFRRPRSMRALPMPLAGGDLAELRPFVNVAEADWPLLAAFLVAALRPSGPYPVLALHGEQGSAKSTTARVVRALIDPSAAPLRAAPRDSRDLAAAADNGWVIALDNLSGLPQSLSDDLSRLATGAGFGARALYTDADEHVIEAARPAIITGIAEVASASDLLDRALVLSLPSIPESERRDERSFWAAFESARPRILGALLDALVTAVGREPEVVIGRLPRMADFARWAVAAEPALGLGEGEFMRAYQGNRAGVHELALDSPLAASLRVIGESPEGFYGTAGELLERAGGLAGEKATRSREWPKSARALSGRVDRLAPNLRAVGIAVERGRGKGRWVAIGASAQTTVATDATVAGLDAPSPQPAPHAGSEPGDLAPVGRRLAPVGDGGAGRAPVGEHQQAPRDPTTHADGDGGVGGDGRSRPRSNQQPAATTRAAPPGSSNRGRRPSCDAPAPPEALALLVQPPRRDDPDDPDGRPISAAGGA